MIFKRTLLPANLFFHNGKIHRINRIQQIKAIILCNNIIPTKLEQTNNSYYTEVRKIVNKYYIFRIFMIIVINYNFIEY